MLPLLNAGSDGIATLKPIAVDLGIVMSENTVKAGIKLGDTISNVKQAFNGFKNKIGAAAIPIIQKFADMIIDGIPKAQNFMQQLTPILTGIFDSVLPPLFELIEMILPIFVFIDTNTVSAALKYHIFYFACGRIGHLPDNTTIAKCGAGYITAISRVDR